MKTLIHNQKDSSICIYDFGQDRLRGAFFKEKPDVGDIIMSHAKRDINFLYIFEVTEIIKKMDSKICSESSYDPVGALFELGIKNVTYDKRFGEVDNSLDVLKK